MLFLRQIQTLTWKNFLIALIRHPVSTPLRAFLLPVVLAWVSWTLLRPRNEENTDFKVSFLPSHGIFSFLPQPTALATPIL